jgi:multidrug efflux pump subunit AcrA (membrane-fusion protein)
MKKITFKKITAAAAAGALVLSLFAGCNRSGGNAAAAAGTQAAAQEAPIFAVNTTTAVQGLIQDYLALSGDIIAGSTVDTYSDAAGKVTELFVSVGSRVNRGARIAAVDPSRPGMTYVTSIVQAPISGIVVALPAQVGMTISQAVPLARIAGGTALEIRLYIAERDISRIAVNLPCEITLDAWPGETFQGSVSEVAPVVDPASRTMEIRVNVDNPGSKLKAGMFAKVKVITAQKHTVVKSPNAAVIQRFGETYVFTAEWESRNSTNMVARRKVIVPGILIDGVLEVEQGLKPDEDVVIRGQTLLEDGARINIIDRVEPISAY